MGLKCFVPQLLVTALTSVNDICHKQYMTCKDKKGYLSPWNCEEFVSCEQADGQCPLMQGDVTNNYPLQTL